MKNYLATWIYLDTKDEKSYFPQVGGDSSEEQFQNTYWRCLMVFYTTSLRYNKKERHLLFTNSNKFPIVDGLDTRNFFEENNIEIVVLDNLYPLPNNYYGNFGNQFFEFSIINYMKEFMQSSDKFLLLDSDCVFTRSIEDIYKELDNVEAATYIYEYDESHVINGISRKDMKTIFEELELKLGIPPFYSAGEILLASGNFITAVASDFANLYKNMLDRNNGGRIKFNEEAHVLSYYYYKHGASLGSLNKYIKRLWTNNQGYRNVEKNDSLLPIWHVPAEKQRGILDIFNKINSGIEIQKMNENKYQKFIYDYLLRPKGKGYKIKRRIQVFLNNFSNIRLRL